MELKLTGYIRIRYVEFFKAKFEVSVYFSHKSQFSDRSTLRNCSVEYNDFGMYG